MPAIPRPVVPALAAALLAPGCALLTAAPPRVEVAAVELRGLGLLDQRLGVTLCVSNPNPEALAFRRVAVSLDVAGAPLAEGASDAAIHLPPLSATVVPFAVATTIRNVGPQLLGVATAGAVDYRLRGTVSLAGALPITVPFGRSGRLGLLPLARGLLAEATPAGTRCDAPP